MRDGLVVVSVHDVMSATLDDARWLLGQFDRLGARPRVLKVVPSPPSDALADLIRAEAAAGSEIVLHGLTHRAAGPLRGPLALRMRGALFAAEAAELLAVAPDDLEDRIVRARDLLARMGVAPLSFCAPGWLSPSGLRPALRSAGFRYEVTMASVVDLTSGVVTRTAPLGYMGAGGRNEVLVALGGGLTLALEPRLPVVKVFLHPQGARSSVAARRVLAALERLLARRRPATYAALHG